MPSSHARCRFVSTRFAIAALATLGLPATVAAQGESVDFERAVQLAVERNERAQTAEERYEAASARVDKARSFFLPDLIATGSYTRRAYETTRVVEGESFTIQSRDALLATAGLSLAIFDARSFPLYRQATSEEDAARLQAIEDRRGLAFDAADAFLVAIGTEQVLGAAERRLEFARGSLQDAQARFDAGLVGSNDVSRAELEAATAARAIADARALTQTAHLQLGNLLDTSIESPLPVPEAFLDSAAAPPAPVEPLIAAAELRRCDLAASREHAIALHFNAREPLMRYVPSVGFNALGRITNEQGFSGRDRDWSLGLNMSWPLYDGGERHADRHERLALASVADLDTRALLRSIDLDVRRARVGLQHSQEAIRAATSAVEAARRNATESSELYRQGLVRALEVADASVRMFEAEVALAGERLGLGRAYLGLRAAVGLDPLGREPEP
jgi:outer membrane protein TolC